MTLLLLQVFRHSRFPFGGGGSHTWLDNISTAMATHLKSQRRGICCSCLAACMPCTDTHGVHAFQDAAQNSTHVQPASCTRPAPTEALKPSEAALCWCLQQRPPLPAPHTQPSSKPVTSHDVNHTHGGMPHNHTGWIPSHTGAQSAEQALHVASSSPASPRHTPPLPLLVHSSSKHPTAVHTVRQCSPVPPQFALPTALQAGSQTPASSHPGHATTLATINPSQPQTGVCPIPMPCCK